MQAMTTSPQHGLRAAPRRSVPQLPRAAKQIKAVPLKGPSQVNPHTLAMQGREEGLGPEEQISGKEDLSAMQESTLRGLHTLDDSQRSANHLSGDAPG